jgi:UDP-N-acetylglucosamine 1-carboxyvinyltransferase
MKKTRKTLNLEITGGKKLNGTVTTAPSKNGAVALLCASLLNRGTTVLKNMPRIEEVYRIIEVLESIGMQARWRGNTITITPPKKFTLSKINKEAAQKTRSVLMLIGPLLHEFNYFSLPQSGGCKLGSRTVRPHFFALEKFGVSVETTTDSYHITRKKMLGTEIVMYESGDTATVNAILAASRINGTTVIKYASANYQVQDVCNFLTLLGVHIEGTGTTTLTIRGVPVINKEVSYSISEDPTDAMFFIAVAIVTNSTLTVNRAPIEFLERELLVLEKMHLKYKILKKYKGKNDKIELADIEIKPSTLVAPPEKITAWPYPSLNIDNLPFFAVIATVANGQTLIHDWVYEKRAIYYTELDKLGADTILADPHRIFIKGPTKLHSSELVCPPALRPATILLIAMLSAKGTSVLRNIYSINRGYENLVERLTSLGGKVRLI